MRLEIESRDLAAQMDQDTIDVSQPFGCVTFMEAVIYDDDGARLHDVIESCEWYRNGKLCHSDPELGDVLPWEFRIDRMKGSEVKGADDLYRCAVTLKEE